MKKILVPTDFSAVAKNAVEYAIEIATVFNSEILLYHVYSFNKATYDIHFKEEEQPFRKEMEQLMQQKEWSLKATVKDKGLSLKTFVEEDNIFSLFETKVKERNVDMIVMGSKGSSGIKKTVFGSVAATALSMASVPVLVIPPKCKYQGIQNIVLAINQTDVAPKVLSPLQKLAIKFNAKVTLLNVKTDSKQSSDKMSHLIIDGVETNYREVPMFKNINETIGRFIKEEGCDLLCMIRREKDIFKKLLQKSAIRTQAFSNQVPLLVLPLV